RPPSRPRRAADPRPTLRVSVEQPGAELEALDETLERGAHPRMGSRVEAVLAHGEHTEVDRVSAEDLRVAAESRVPRVLLDVRAHARAMLGETRRRQALQVT